MNFKTFDVCKSMHHHTFQINQPTRCNNFTSLLLDVYVWLKIFRAPLRPSSGAYDCTSNLWFYRWRMAVAALLVVVTRPRPTTLLPPLLLPLQDATVSQVYCLTFMCGSTCFGRLSVHHQEHTTALATSGFIVGEWR